jgi:hypothetical protein
VLRRVLASSRYIAIIPIVGLTFYLGKKRAAKE